MALFSECTVNYGLKVLDTADIVREAMLQQLSAWTDPAMAILPRGAATRKFFNMPNVLEHPFENCETVKCISQFAMLPRVCDRQSP